MTAKLQANQPCPCGSGHKYKRCCRPLHAGDQAATPEALMRSRFVAYAADLADYVIATTDPAGPQARPDRAAWEREVHAFCAGTEFEGLEVLGSGADRDEGWVHFHARLRQGERDASFVERSRFVRRAGRWLYHSADSD